MKAALILANGSVFRGESIGATADRVCEMVFNTSMTGYQEILTDPSYAGQGIVMSYPSLAITASIRRITSPSGPGQRRLSSGIWPGGGAISAVRAIWTPI